jgi:hypothetical protein
MSRMKRLIIACLPLGFLVGCAGAKPPAPTNSEDDEADSTQGQEGEDPGAATLDSDGPNAPKSAPALAAEAARIVTDARETTYSHKTVVDEAELRFDVDCSAFVGYVLRRVAPEARHELSVATVKRPLAKHFTTFIDGLPAGGAGHWQHVADARELRDGDVVAWIRPADSKNTNTGHTMLVAGPPVVHGTDVVVPIFDSTEMRHGATDHRAADSRSGVGRGSIILRVDGAGYPREFRWSPTGRYRYHKTDIALGRVRP